MAVLSVKDIENQIVEHSEILERLAKDICEYYGVRLEKDTEEIHVFVNDDDYVLLGFDGKANTMMIGRAWNEKTIRARMMNMINTYMNSLASKCALERELVRLNIKMKMSLKAGDENANV